MVNDGGEVTFSLQGGAGDGDYVEDEDKDTRTLEDILSELQTQTGVLKGKSKSKSAPAPQSQNAKSPQANGKQQNLTEAVKRSQEARTSQLKGIRGRLDIISDQLENLPEKMGAAQKSAMEKTDKEESKSASESKAKTNAETPSKKPAEGETAKEKSKWSAFTAKARKKNGMLSNEGTDRLDAKISGLRDQANGIANTFHALGMHGIGDRFASLAADGGLLETLGAKLFLPALAIYGGLKIAGGAVEAIRNTRNRDINQSVNAVEAGAETAQNGLYDFLHKFGFSAVSGRDLTEFRNADLDQNFALFSEKGDALFSALKSMTSHGWTTSADKEWATEMVAMGDSAGEVKSQFMSLSKIAAATGISFKNLSQAVATESTNATKALGKQAGEEVKKELPKAMGAMKEAGFVANEKTLSNLETNGEFKVAEDMALIQMGYPGVASHALTPSVLLEETLAHGAFPLALQIFNNKERSMTGGGANAEELEASNLEAQGIQMANVQTSLTTAFAQGGSPVPEQKHSIAVSISTSPELSAKVSQDNSYAQAIHGQWQSYYQVNNYGKKG